MSRTDERRLAIIVAGCPARGTDGTVRPSQRMDGCGAAVDERLDCSPPIRANRIRIPGRVTPGFSQEGIMPNDVPGRRVFSRISRFTRPCIPALYASANGERFNESDIFKDAVRTYGRRTFDYSKPFTGYAVVRIFIAHSLRPQRHSAARRQKSELQCFSRGRGDVVVRLLVSHLGGPDRNPGGVSIGFSHVGMVPGNAAGRRIFSGSSCPPPSFHYTAL
ncbi:hypothetical protein PR048_026315 [Dryococelus australis]|uniref:Uncharacterized protein n=1 Tax=Dryococelus australis TaxID=614101 RepID=A0ABQ9GL08_9NEOP|nr:hypothetical protein PR048_026315 [Dryococelus australis]